MPDQPQKTNPLKPTMPQVPGLSAPGSPPPRGLASELNRTALLVLGIAAFVVVGGLILYFALRPSRHSSKDDRFAAADSGSNKSVPGDTSRHSNAAITLQDLAQPWSSKTFKFQSLTSATVSAMIIRLPAKESDQTQSYWAFSLTEAYGSCQLEYITDLNRLSSEYGFQAGHPMLVNPCKRAVYDPLQMASLPTGALVRGAIVHGSALRPPLAIDVRIEGDQIIPVQME